MTYDYADDSRGLWSVLRPRDGGSTIIPTGWESLMTMGRLGLLTGQARADVEARETG